MTNSESIDPPTAPANDLPPALPTESVLAAPVTESAPVETSTEVEVGLQRSVRYGRILVVGAALGAVIAGLVALAFPVGPDATYELGQAVGFALVIGATAGLVLGALLALALGQVAKRSRGGARAIQTDVQ